MAVATLHPMFMDTRGKMGRLVYYNRRGTECIRRHVVPRNPDTNAQRTIRTSFSDAVHAWQALPLSEKAQWNHKARYKPMTGYNMFVSRYMKQNLPAVSRPSSGIQAVFTSPSTTNPARIPSVPGGIQLQEQLYYDGIQQVVSGKG